MSQSSEDSTSRGDGKTWYVIYITGASLYLLVYYLLIEIVNVGMYIAVLLFLTLPFYIMYLNEFYVFYTEEFDPEKPPIEELDENEETDDVS